jgi:hypothetical protein
MAIQLQHRREERTAREKQLQSGETRLTHIRPAPKHSSEIGSQARFRNGYRKNSYFGPHCMVVSSRVISDLSELLETERQHLTMEFSSIARLKDRGWTKAPKLEVLVLDVI